MIMMVNGKEVCQSNAIYSKDSKHNSETIIDMTPCPDAIPLTKGDEISLQSIYDLKSHPL
jgi:hypothetical protein